MLCTLAVPIIAVITKSDLRREAGFDSYGPPPREGPQLPPSVYGVPGQPAGIPISKYGPPKVQVEYGIPPPQQQQQYHVSICIKFTIIVVIIIIIRNAIAASWTES